MTLDIWLNAFLALFAIINPIGNVAIFADFTENLDRRTRITLFNVVIGAGYGTLLVMSLAGSWIMTAVFQINIDEFRIAGGIILTVLAVRYIVFRRRVRKFRLTTPAASSRSASCRWRYRSSSGPVRS